MLIALPDPLRNDLTKARRRVIQRRRDPHRHHRRHIARHPRTQRAARRKRPARTQHQRAIPLRVRIRRQQARRQPARAAQRRRQRDVPAARVAPVRRPPQQQAHHVPDQPRRHRHQLRLDRRVPQPGDDGRAEEGQRPQRHRVAQVREVVRQHARARARLEDFVARRFGAGVAAALARDALLDERLVGGGEEARARGVVGQEEEDEEDAEDGDEPFDDEEPAEAGEGGCAVDVADAVGDAAAEGAGGGGGGEDEGDADGALFDRVPEGDEVDAACGCSVFVAAGGGNAAVEAYLGRSRLRRRQRRSGGRRRRRSFGRRRSRW